MDNHLKPVAQLEDPRPDEGGLQSPSTVENWLMPYVEDQMLWPVLLVLLLHAAAFVAPVLILAFRDLKTGPIFSIGLLLFLSARVFRYDWRVRRRFGAFSWTVVATWVLSIGAAYASHRTGLF